MIYIGRVSSQFAEKVTNISQSLGVNPDWLMFVINLETAGTFDPSITNSIGATGLIQFMPDTANELGTNTNALRQMNAVTQLDYVYEYLRQKINVYGTPENVTDFYTLIFYPASVNWNDNQKYPDNVYTANKGLDYNRDKILTKGDLRQYINSKYTGSSLMPGNILEATTTGEKSVDESIKTKKNIAFVLLSFLAIFSSAFTIYLLTKNKKQK